MLLPSSSISDANKHMVEAPSDSKSSRIDEIGEMQQNLTSLLSEMRQQSGPLEWINKLQSELPRLDRLQASLQKDFDARSSVGHLAMLDLPDELLMSIFGHTRGHANIRNIRLTCRRFCSTSSHFLLDCLQICATPASIARAQEISSHPAISKGIRAIHICLRSYDDLDFSAFRNLTVVVFKNNIRAQQRTLQDGTFVQAIAAAAGQMPTVTSLRFKDDFRYRASVQGFYTTLWTDQPGASDLFDEWITQSINWHYKRSKVAPSKLVAQIQSAVHTACSSTVEVGIEFLSTQMTRWIHDQDQLLSLEAAARSLKVFTFRHLMGPLDLSQRISSVPRYLSAVLGSGSIEVLTLEFVIPQVLQTGRHESAHVGPLLTSLRWPRLRKVNLVSASMHLSDLKIFISGLRPGVVFKFDHVHLLSGTWAEGLDVLCAIAHSTSELTYLTDQGSISTSDEQTFRMFYGGRESLVSRYVQGASIRNPFLVTQDEAAGNGMNTDST
ncbi:hypothetical protein J7T55_013471 [Diaporthe amygdali]|uniref:uncharacterized protein n=1 Tax=Phomopsis amygdali TaxID=1214568 RepID=UPI0022FE6DCC|nr:uncharacterized protein J7T55_013471 [Diaporthe amygdali]KAJ0119234.1 hypothetical protein J7T55_013471 [Diaporthe amygdali]